MLIADISSHNTITSWPAFLGSVDGLIAKISEGVGYVWPGAQNALNQARSAGKLVGVYHFASAGDPIAEADFFLANYTHRSGEVIVLDWEPGGFNGDADAWCHAWCQRVIAATGVVPMVYLNVYYATRQSQWPRTRALGCGLWAAWYGSNTGVPQSGMPSFAPWPDPAMWQYTSNGSRAGHSGALDLNQFNGTADQWRAYGTPGGKPGGLFMYLSEAQEREIYARIMGFLAQRWYVTNPDGSITYVPEGTPGATPAHALDSMDGNLLVQMLSAEKGQIAGLTEAIKQISSASGQPVDLAAITAAAKAGAEEALKQAVNVNVNVGSKPTP